MQCNFRSSLGFGKHHLNAGNGEWAAKMHEDLLDAAEWAIRKGITTRDKVGIWGKFLFLVVPQDLLSFLTIIFDIVKIYLK